MECNINASINGDYNNNYNDHIYTASSCGERALDRHSPARRTKVHDHPRGVRCNCQVTQPIKLEAKFPAIPNKQPDEKFKLVLTDIATDQTLFDVLLEEKTIYRKNLELPYSTIPIIQTKYTSCASGYGLTETNSIRPLRKCMCNIQPMKISTR